MITAILTAKLTVIQDAIQVVTSQTAVMIALVHLTETAEFIQK
jgi:hypothetical protein